MASAKPAAPTRRSSAPKGPQKNGDSEISRARWAGVALVIAAIIGAIILAVVSPSDPTTETQPGGATAEATPTATVLDTRVPSAQPRITNPLGGTTREIVIPVTVDVPEEELPRRLVRLLILRGDAELGSEKIPKGGGKVVVQDVRLVSGPNELVATLDGPGGHGPLSEPVVVTLDRDAPPLAITSPKNKSETYDDTVLVTGTSEVGAKIELKNEANGFTQPLVVGESGEFAITMRLKRGGNRIVATSVDTAGMDREEWVRIKLLDGRPAVKVDAPDRVRKSSLPRRIKVAVDVTDAGGKKMEGADVFYSLGGPGRNTITESDVTNANGKSTWNPMIERSTSPADAVELSVTVTSPTSGESKIERHAVDLN